MKALHRLLRLLTVLPILISAVVLPLLPERIPAHYNLAGEIDRWGSRLEIFILPVFCLVSGFLWERTLHKLVASDPQADADWRMLCPGHLFRAFCGDAPLLLFPV